MYKILLLAAVLGCSLGYPITQEELAQYVARQQTAGPLAIPRRQPYLLQAQPRQVYQPQPQTQEQPQYVQAQPQYVQPQPQYVQAQPQYAQAQPQYAQAQPQYARPAAKRPPRPLQLKPGQPGQPGQLGAEPEDYDPNPQYQFAFDIKDDEFTNYQQRKEQREGDKISGSYSVVDADGYIRTVTYTADPLEGFKADVVRQPTDIKVKIPVHPPSQGSQQLLPQQLSQDGVVARKQQTQQYLQASNPAQGRPQYIFRPEQVQAYVGAQPQLKQLSAIPYAAQAVAAAPKAVKASAIGYAQQPTASPILYQAYHQ